MIRTSKNRAWQRHLIRYSPKTGNGPVRLFEFDDAWNEPVMNGDE
jgi:hypothetical protein